MRRGALIHTWTAEEDRRLTEGRKAGAGVGALARALRLSRIEVVYRLRFLGMGVRNC